MSDDIQSMTAQLAADPTSLVFLELGEALRQRRQVDAAFKVARTGIGRYPDLAAAHDLMARILADRGDNAGAFDAWQASLALDADHVGANKGVAFLYFRASDADNARAYLERAARAAPEDVGIRAALERLERGGSPAAEPADARVAEALDSAGRASGGAPVIVLPPMPDDSAIFEGLEGARDGLLLLDGSGMRLGGGLRGPSGAEVSDAVAAQLAGVSREATRAARLLDLGAWQSVAAESADGNLYLVPVTPDTVLLTSRDPSVPVGRLALVAERAARVARTWLERLG